MNISVEEIAYAAINQFIKKIQNPHARNRDIVIEMELITRQPTEKVTKIVVVELMAEEKHYSCGGGEYWRVDRQKAKQGPFSR